MLHKKVRLDPCEIFKGVTKAILKVACRKFDEVPEALYEGLGIEMGDDETEKVARQLFERAMTDALTKLALPYHPDLQKLGETGGPAVEAFLRDVAARAHEATVDLMPDLFVRPRELPFLRWYQARFETWLFHCGYELPKATTVAARLPVYFADALIDEFRQHIADYDPLIKFLNNPAVAYWRDERSWESYRLAFDREMAEPLFWEPFALDAVFVPPRAFYRKRPLAARRSRHSEPEREESNETLHVVDLAEYLNAWWDAADRQDAYRVLVGDPGAGKSSAARVYAQSRLHADARVLYVPLHSLNVVTTFQSAIDEFCNQTGRPNKLLDSSSAPDRLLIVLDGLDELTMRGAKGEKSADEFAEEVVRTVENRNQDVRRDGNRAAVQVLFCGRPGSVHAVANRFRADGQIVQLLPYFVAERDRQRYDDPEERLAIDCRGGWWDRYGRAMQGQPLQIPDYLTGPQLDDVTGQPLLNHLVAFAVTQRHRRNGQPYEVDLLPDGVLRLNRLYRHLIDCVYDRDWGRHGGGQEGYAVTKALSDADTFHRLLTVMGLAAWQDVGNRTTTVAAVERLATAADLGGALHALKAQFGQEAGTSRLFTAFYWRRIGGVTPAEETYEFTHKSFGEYLAAARLVEVYFDIAACVGKPKPGGVWQPDELLLEWLRIAGANALSADVYRYIVDEVSDRPQSQVQAGRQAGVVLLNAALRSGMPAHKLDGLSFPQMADHAGRAEHALLCLIGACTRAVRTTEDRPPPPVSRMVGDG